MNNPAPARLYFVGRSVWLSSYFWGIAMYFTFL